MFARRRTRWGAVLGLALLDMVARAGGVAQAGPQAVDGGIRFIYSDAYAEQVFIAGSFNDWNTSVNPMTLDGEVWSVVVPLEAGLYEYKFVVDGQWVADPTNPETTGEFGNSAVTVNADGTLRQAAAVTTLPYSPKIQVGGRVISLFQTREEADGLRLRRPDFDFDIDFDIGISELLTAHLLTNIRNESENVQFFQTSLYLDRGKLTFRNVEQNLEMAIYDNEDMGRFDDPLALVGDVGIYDHGYGFDTQGVHLGFERGAGSLTLLYSDDFETGGTTTPQADPAAVVSTVVDAPGDPGAATAYTFFDTDNNKDVLAFRGRYAWREWHLGGSGRFDRGYNPGAFVFAEIFGDTSASALLLPATVEEWWAAGFDLRGDLRPDLEFYGEYLHGEARANPSEATRIEFTLTPVVQEVGSRLVEGTSLDIDTSERAVVGLRWEPADFLRLEGSYEVETHEIAAFVTSTGRFQDNLLNTFRAKSELELERWAGRPLTVGLDVDVFDFQYGSAGAWETQFWFDSRNFWLEQDEHEVTVDRLVMLGGNDVVSFHPRVAFPLWVERQLDFEYEGRINTIDLSTEPKFIESLFRFTYPVNERVKLHNDTRWVKYNDPVLEIAAGFVSNFIELSYEFSPGVNLALSWGVDPTAIDEPTNEYDYVGRDLFLFQRGATGATARSNFFSLGDVIPEAEQALEDERRLQIEAVVRF